MGSSCSSGQKDKDGKKKSKKGKAEQTPRGSNASNSSVYVYQKAPTPPTTEIPAPLPQFTPQSTPVPTHPTVQKTDSQPSPTSPTQKDSLPSYTDFPEVVRPLLLGNVTQPPPHFKPRKIVLYLCADYKDTVQERAIITDRVTPKIRRHCAERGYELDVVDVHLGCKALKSDVRDVSIQQLRRNHQHCHLVPVVFLNETVGHCSLPPTISQEQKEMLDKSLKTEEDKELFDKFYWLDENNSPPHYQLSNELEESDVDRLVQILEPSWRSSDDGNSNHLTTYLEDVANEVIALGPQHNKRSCICISRKFTQHPPATSEDDKWQSDRFASLQSNLQSQMDRTRILNFSIRWSDGNVDPSIQDHGKYLDDLCTKLQAVVIALSDAIIENVETNSPDTGYLGMDKRLLQELIQQTNECRNRTNNFVGQNSTLSQLMTYLRSEAMAPLILHGPPGSGKTAVAAKLVEECSRQTPNTPVVFRFVGLTPDSATTDQVMRSICEQCCLLFGEHPSIASQGMLRLTKELPLLFKKVSSSRPLVVVIDGIDQVQFYSSLSLAWVPAVLPLHVKLLITLRDDTAQLAEMKALLPDPKNWISMTPLNSGECQQIVQQILQENKRTVTTEQQNAINICLETCSLPLSATVIAYGACQWPSLLLEPVIPAELDAQIQAMFDRIEDLYENGEVGRVLGYLTAAKHGLMDTEVMDLMSCDNALDGLPHRLIWATIGHQLSNFLMTSLVGRLSVSHWRDVSCRAVAEKRYLADDELASVSRFMVDYYQSKWAEGKEKKSQNHHHVLEQPIKFGGVYNRRKLDELPLHAHRSSDTSQTYEFLFNPDWLRAKVCGSDVYQLIEDLNMVDPRADVTLLRETLELSAYALSYDGSQLFSQIMARVAVPDSNKCPAMAALHTVVRNDATKSSLMPLGLCLHSPGAVVDTTESPDQTIYFDSVHRLKGSTTHMLTLSADSGEVSVVSIYDQKRVRTLTGLTQPKDVKMMDEFRALVLCNRELKVYNLDECTFEVKLKGVMNQKMPFYGLHDSEHVVSLSRNRMYVHMTNLQSGDCVANFKVGEDRFLNSLLVSTNGKMCVCGDETQKPFPLLVWDLDSRKLVYDLRIPHHEFITRLATITNDGHYVASVCKEVGDPAPNFIIVYDLQSGTLFKKWKPEVNTCSIVISSEGGCVVNGLEDATLLVWDLLTGTCRFCLKGHCAPVDHIQIDDGGTVCVTFDSTDKDRSVRVWNTVTGEALAVFTPDAPIICCELSTDGRAVVLGLRGRKDVLTLLLCNRQSAAQVKPRDVPCFGDPANTGKMVDLSEEG